MKKQPMPFIPPATVMRWAKVLAIVGGFALVVGFAIDRQYACANLLLASFFLVTLGLAGAVLVALQYVASAGWGVAVRRVPEAMTAVLPIGLAGILVVLACAFVLYPWASAGHGGSEHFHGFKQAWLQGPFVFVRAVIYGVAWLLLAWAIVGTSRRQDQHADPGLTERNRRLSALFLVVFAFTFWLASYDWIMSLDLEWASTAYGLYNFAGLILSGVAVVILLALWLNQVGPFRGVLTKNHLHDLGKLLFAFSTFWVYIWFCQYMLIWYVNNPEETAYYIDRLEGAWEPLFLVNVLINWLIPFFILLPRSTKRHPKILAQVCVLIVVGRWLDLYLQIVPSLHSTHLADTLQNLDLGWNATLLQGLANALLGMVSLAMFAGTVGLFVLVTARALAKVPCVPLNDPYLVESLPHHEPESRVCV